MTDLVIFGAGGFAREVHELSEDLVSAGGPWNPIGFVDGNTEMHGQRIHDLPVFGGIEWLVAHPEVAVVVAVGDTGARRSIVQQMQAAGVSHFATLVHPQALVGRRVRLGSGVIVCAGTSITTDLVVEDHVIFNLDCTVGHDSHIHPFVTVAPGAHISGNVTIGSGSNIGTGAAIIQGVSVGEGTVVGAGAVVARDIPANVTAVGIPARAVRQHEVLW